MIKYLCLFFVSLPLLFALSVADGFDVHLARLWVISAGILYIAQGLYRKRLIFPRGPIAFILLALLLLASCSVFYSDVPPWSMRKAIYFWSFAPLFIVLVSIFTAGENARHKVTKAVVIGGGIASIVGVVQFFLQFIVGRDVLENFWQSITPFFLGGTFSESVATFNSWFVHIAGYDLFRAIAFFPDPHVYAFYTGMIAPFALFLWHQNKEGKWLWCFGVIILADLLTFSRGGEVALLVALFPTLFYIWPTLGIKAKHTLIALCAVGMLLAVMPNPLIERFASSFSATDTSNTARTEIWQEALQIWAQYPVMGVGLGAYPHAVDPEATYRTPIYAHNIFLDIGVELGLVGCILFVSLLLRMFYIFHNKRNILGICAIISMIILLTHGLFDTPIFSVHVFPLILFLAALAASYEQSTISQKTS